jgi:dihydrofolate reductase
MATTGKLTLTTFLTLDGIMQAPGAPEEDRSGNFSHGGWLVPYADADMRGIVSETFSAADAFLLGRKTYEIFAAYWPRVTDPNDVVAEALNRLPKYVASGSLKTAEWNNTTVIRGDIAKQVTEIKKKHPREVQVHGSGDLAQTLIANDLIDEYRLWIYPIVLGTGKRLFPQGISPAALELVKTQRTSTGVVVNTYKRTGKKPTFGSFALDQ